MEIGKGVVMEHSPDSVLPPLPHPFRDSDKRGTRSKPPRRDEILRVKEGFTEISFRRYRSTSCKNFSSKPLPMEAKLEQRRGSVYQSSKHVFREMRFTGNTEEMAKLGSSVTDSSYRQENAGKRLQNCPSDQKYSVESLASSNFIDICLNSGIKDRAAVLDSDEEAACSPNRCDDHRRTLPKSYSAKIESSRGQFGHIRKMFDPFVKSKSMRSPLGYIGEAGEFKMERTDKTMKDSDQCNDNRKKMIVSSSIVNKDHTLDLKSSPVHLYGRLKVENRDGLPIFRFVLDFPEDVYVAKAWKPNNGSNWIYTFSSIGNRKKSNASSWGLSDCGRESSFVGQMQVSSYMCSELRKNQEPEKLMVSEFVLYDIAHARRSVSTQENSSKSHDSVKISKNSVKPDADLGHSEPIDGSDMKRVSESCDLDGLNESNLWPTSDLPAELEIAAIVIEDQIEKRESLKYKRGDQMVAEKMNLLSLSPVEEGKKSFNGGRCPEKLKVVIPRGNHSIATCENSGPSPLLHRWRSGGGCDCGGWDMACPLVVFGNPSLSCSRDQPLVDNHCPLELFVKGAKESTPALSMSMVEEGQYDIHFHAQLSTLQALSICVAILHNMEASGSCKNSENIRLSQHNSLKMLIDDKVKCLVEAVAAKEEKKKQITKTAIKGGGASATLQSYMPNPPFSPISRV